MERVRIGKDIVFQWEVRKDGAALTAGDAANLTLEIAGRNGKSQRLPFEIRDSKIIAAWYGVQQTEIGAYRLACWHNRGKVGESVVDVVWAVELVRYTTEETFDDIETVTIELEGGNLTFAALKGASAYEVAVAEGFVGTEAEWIASLKKPAEDAAEDAEEAAARAIEAAENAGAAATIAETAAQTAENAAGDANTAAGLANSAADNAEAKAQLADAAADNANTAANEAYNKAQEADTAATTATNAAQSANSAAASADEAARGAVEAAVEATQSAENAQTQADNAHSAADHAYEMAIGAEKVNAQLNGNVLTITNRQGTSTSVNTKGEQGEQGNPGQAATISVGTTTTGAPGTDAQVTNSGTSSAAVLNFTIPKGDKGPQGEPGEVTEAEMNAALALKEDKANKVTEIGDDSTDVQYPSAKGVWTAIKNAIAFIKQWATGLFARTDGYYSRMIVGGAESLIGDVPQTATYTFRRTGGGAIGEPVARLTEVQGNTGVVNQLVQNGDFADGTDYWEGVGSVTFTVQENKAIVVYSARNGRFKHNLAELVSGHKYCVLFYATTDINATMKVDLSYGWANFSKTTVANERTFINGILTAGAEYTQSFVQIYPVFTSGVNEINVVIENVNIFDLTLMYGAGYEPGTVAEFEARIWRDYGKTLDEYIAYTQGKLINCKAVALESYNTDSELIDTINLNLATLTGINPTTGVRETIFPNGAGGGEGWRSALRVVNDATVAVVNTARVNLGDFTYTQYNTTSQKKRWAVLLNEALAPASNTNVANIKCSRYATTTASNIYSEVQGVAISNTSLLQIYDNALQGTAAEFKAAMDGVYLEFQLATPIVYTDIQYADGTPFVLPRNYEVQNDGTERITHAEGEDSIAPVMSAIYGLNAVGFIQDAPKDYTSQATLDSLTSLLSSLTGHSITKTWDAANNKWVFS